MFNPQGSDNDSTGTNYTFSHEWTELYNNSASTIDVSGWQFGDSLDNTWASPFPSGTMIGAGQALVVTGDTTTFDANWGPGINRIGVTAFPNQANSIGTNEAAAIRNATGVIQDAVRYQETGWPTANGSDGNSIFLMPDALSSTANDIGTNWKPSSAGAYGARWTNAGGEGENHGSPGFVATATQAPFEPSPNAVWSVVVFPDTQNYSKSSVNLPIFSQLTNWVKDNRDLYNIKVVMQEGDLVNQNSQVQPTSGDQSGDQQWANARAAMSVLDGHVPYIIAPGNHDLGTTSAQNRSTQLNDYFQPSQNPLNDPAAQPPGILKGVYESGHLENAYFEVAGSDGRNLLIFALEFWPRQDVVAWAGRIAAQPKYQDFSAVVLTHSYLNWNNQLMNADPDTYGVGAGGDYNDGIHLWNELVKVNGNFEMTFSGHVGGDGIGYLKGTNNEGDPVHQMLINSQFETNGGNGWFRIVEFLDDGKTARVRTFSPFLGYARTDAANDYYITLSQLPMTPGDFNVDDAVDGADLAIWKSGLGAGSGAARITGDADADGDVDGADFLVWQRNFGAPPSLPPGQAVPEPEFATGYLLAMAAIAALSRRLGSARHANGLALRLA